VQWYYARGNEQVGPLDDADFEIRVQTGEISDETLVWNETMKDWLPYGDVKYAAPARAAAPVTPVLMNEHSGLGGGDMIPCAECGTPTPSFDMVQYKGQYICPRCKPLYFQRVAEGSARLHMRYAGFWIRLVAKFIDGLIVGLPLMIAAFALGIFAIDPENPGATNAMASFIQLPFFVVNFAYSVFFHGKYGATPGKMVVGIRVVRSDNNAITFGRAAGRYLGEILSGLICNIGYIIAAFDDQKRSLHDHLADTRVVYK
jgi:uncharacterized RDD family membrane protein YckC